MYLDFDDHRPDVPRVPSAPSLRVGVVTSLAAHMAIVAILVGSQMVADRRHDAPSVIHRPDPVIRYVQMTPRVDAVAMPERPAELSDRDRRSATRERAPNPENSAPFSRGTTTERTEGGPPEGVTAPDPPAAAQPQATSEAPKPAPTPAVDPSVPAPASAGRLSESLRDLRQYLETQNFNNPRGGLTDHDPDIQFDAKGVEFGPWLRRFVAQVKRNWYAPQILQPGRVVVQFYVMKNGALLELRVVQSASIEALTISAVNALRMSNPTLPLPTEYPTDRAFFTVTFHYNEGSRH